MGKLTIRYAAVTLVAGICLTGNVLATNGYFAHGIGAKSKALAGSGVAMREADAIAIAGNPAKAVYSGDSLVIGLAVFSPKRSYTTSQSQLNGNFGAFTIGPNNLDSDGEYFFIPHVARTWALENNSAWGFAFYGHGGMNTDWRGGTATFDPDGPGPAPVMTLPGTYGGGDAGVDLSQAFLDLTWGKALNDRWSVGIAAIFAAQVFEATGLASFAGFTETFAASGGTVFPSRLTNNGHDWSYGAGVKFGVNLKASESLSFGAMYHSRISMSEFDDYSDLFAEQGDFDIPQKLKVGLTYLPSERLTLNLDIERIWYSDIDSVGNSIANIFACPTAGQGGMDLSSCLGGNRGAGFGWDDMTSYKAGLAWVAGEDWTWRLGYSYGDQPIPNTQMTFNILAPGVMEQHFTAGFTLERTPNRQFNLAVMFSPSVEVTGAQNFDPTQNVSFKMYQLELEASYSWRF